MCLLFKQAIKKSTATSQIIVSHLMEHDFLYHVHHFCDIFIRWFRSLASQAENPHFREQSRALDTPFSLNVKHLKMYVDIGVNMLMMFTFLICVTLTVHIISCQRYRPRHILTALTIFQGAGNFRSISPSFRFSLARSCGAGEAEAEEVVSVAGYGLAAVCRAAVPGVAVPTAPAQDTAAARCWTLRIKTWTILVIDTSMPILTPLPHIAVHIIKAPGVR